MTNVELLDRIIIVYSQLSFKDKLICMDNMHILSLQELLLYLESFLI